MIVRELSLDTKEIIEELKVFLPKLLTACDSLSDLFYEKISEQSWEVFGQFVGSLNDLYKIMEIVENELQATEVQYAMHPFIMETISALSKKYTVLTQYVEAEAFVSVGDLIKHELAPLFKKVMVLLGERNDIQERRFIENLNFLKDTYANVYEFIKDIKRDETNYQIFPASDGSANLVILSNNSNKTYMYSQYNPNYEAFRWAQSIVDTTEETEQMLIYGLGFGYHLIHFAQTHPNMDVYLYEPDEQVLLAAMYVIDLKTIFSLTRVKMFAVGEKEEEVDRLLYLLSDYCDDSVPITSMPIYNRLYGDQKKWLFERIESTIISDMMNKQTIKGRGLQHAKNILYNVAANLSTPSLAVLHNQLFGKPAVIVGAGPSLESDIEYLRTIKEYAIIIAAGTSIQSLQHFGIVPHIVVSIDGMDINYEAFKKINREDIMLIYIPQVEHRIVDAQYFNTMHAFFGNDEISNYVMGISGADPVFQGTYSVTGTAIQIAAYMGCKEIILTGQDLSYPTDSMYAAGTVHVGEEQGKTVLAEATYWVENVNGSMNKTNLSMKLTLKNIESQIAEHPDVYFTNTSQKGAKINNTNWESMEETIKRLASQMNSNDSINKILQSQYEGYDAARKSVIESKLYELPREISELENRVHWIERKLAKLPELSRINADKCLRSMAAIEDEWGEVVSSNPFISIYQYVLKVPISEFDRNLPELASEKNIHKKASLFVQILGELVRAIKTATPEIKLYVEEAVQRVQKLSKD
ncbi:6-hydroxymethylpterin diphosphokinase MptE-like protein [Paenibacillus gorillae]|uniref:motility associated factor glycosyltransferase family protein n=1 Tax=Paenibacillus gorillae TaxID=1243662 RepID=UPI0004ACCDEA|nr:6-hydroxymethylpterin diphosphokinase MptE-like protein [Paenibacillus gorillae]